MKKHDDKKNNGKIRLSFSIKEPPSELHGLAGLLADMIRCVQFGDGVVLGVQVTSFRFAEFILVPFHARVQTSLTLFPYYPSAEEIVGV
jgi:hypothetical protein